MNYYERLRFRIPHSIQIQSILLINEDTKIHFTILHLTLARETCIHLHVHPVIRDIEQLYISFDGKNVKLYYLILVFISHYIYNHK